jgi:hypothetical protein
MRMSLGQGRLTARRPDLMEQQRIRSQATVGCVTSPGLESRCDSGKTLTAIWMPYRPSTALLLRPGARPDSGFVLETESGTAAAAIAATCL